jgi:hypothetical protein
MHLSKPVAKTKATTSAAWKPMAERLNVSQGRTGARRRAYVDYRDRISVATWLIVFGLGLSLIIDLPTVVVNLRAFRTPLNISLNETVLAAVVLAVLAAAGTESVISVHPRLRGRGGGRRTWATWALPMALTIIATLLLPAAKTRQLQVAGLLVTGALLALILFFLYATVEPGRSGFRRSRLVLDALAYGSALILFVFVYQTRTRSLLSGPLIAGTAVLLAVEILRTTTRRQGVVWSYGLIIGLVLGEVTWALNYWKLLPGLTGGLILLLIFYLFTGLAQQGVRGRLTRRVVIEFAVFTLLALILIALVGPGFQQATSF